MTVGDPKRSVSRILWGTPGAVAILAALHLGLYARNLLGAATFYYQDFPWYQLPLRSLVAEALREGRLPLWNPFLWLGTPLAANPAALTFYPPTWLVLGLDDVTALNVLVVAHLFLGGLLTYFLARTRVREGPLALVAGVAFSLGGVALSYTANPFYLFSLAWLPALLLCAEGALRAHAYRRSVLGALTLALMFLGGDLQLALVGGLLVALLAAAHVLVAPREERPAVLRRAALMLATIGLGGATLAAVQLLPSLELAGLSERAAGVSAEVRSQFTFHPRRLATFWLPYLFGAPYPVNSYWGFAIGDGMRLWFLSVYAGSLVALGACFAVRRRDPFTLAGGAAIVLLTLLALGPHTPLERLVAALPLLGQFRYPEKYLAPLAVLLPVLGVEGLARVAAGEGRRRGLLFSLVAAVLAVVGAVLWSARAGVERLVAARVSIPGLAEVAAARIASDGRNLFLVAGAALVVTLLARRGRLSPRAAAVALAVIAGADVLVAGVPLRLTAPSSPWREPPTLPAHATGEVPPMRVVRASALMAVPLHRDEEGLRALERASFESLRPNENVLVRVGSLIGYGALYPREFRVLLNLSDDDLLAVARVAGIPWFVVPARDERGRRSVRFQAIEGALPEVRLVGAELVSDSVERAPQLARGGHDFAATALVEAGDALLEGERLPEAAARAAATSLPRAAGGGSGSARVVSYRPEEMLVETSTPTPAVLVATETFFPGWRASVDGSEVPIHRADFFSRAVAVPAGRHTVRFWYEAPAIAAGARVTVAGAGALFLVGLLLWRRGRRAAAT